MIKRVIIGILILSLCLLCASIVFILEEERYLDEIESIRWPNNLSSYDPDAGFHGSEIGYYRIDPETILLELEKGNTDVFVPLLDDPDLDYESTDNFIAWKQADFLKIVSALGQITWNDPMDLNEWNVFHIYFSGACEDEATGFDYASVTYFKTITASGKEVYMTRRVEIIPYRSVVRWGGGATYSKTFFHRWTKVDLAGAEITADDALRIVLERDHSDAYLQERNRCHYSVSAPQDGYGESWYVNYHVAIGSFRYAVYLDTGEYEFLNPSK